MIGTLDHAYGEHVHIINDPYFSTLLADLSSKGTGQPRLNWLLTALYRGLLGYVFSHEFPKQTRQVVTRMDEPLTGEFLDPETKVVTVDIARAGIMPSMVAYELLNMVLDPAGVRQDHIIIQRTVGSQGTVTGAQISGTKVGGPIDGRILLFPDPMGATGSSLTEVMRFYLKRGTPLKMISLNLIITPEFIRKVHNEFPETRLYAFRLDRGLSPAHVLAAKPGLYWDQERGLNDKQYIIPGAGGLGETLNNAED